jgi:hypothetical protein
LQPLAALSYCHDLATVPHEVSDSAATITTLLFVTETTFLPLQQYGLGLVICSNSQLLSEIMNHFDNW